MPKDVRPLSECDRARFRPPGEADAGSEPDPASAQDSGKSESRAALGISPTSGRT
jgi:hypothetical protein